ncbi:MAG: hypothetical protein PVH45_04940 [Candidatus Omnitrophota bacterium]|jgi:hypothetical protein
MIELNLLPKELRKVKKKATALPAIPVMPVCIGVVAVLVVVHLTFLLLINNNRGLSVKLTENWNQMQPQKKKTDAFFTELNKLQKRVEAIREIAKPDLSWAKILSGLNQAIVANVWLSDFKLTFKNGGRRDEEQKLPVSLDLTGYAVGRSEVALPTVGRFMESLKNNKDFSGYFEEIELEDIRNFNISGEEVMMFKLVCHFKKIETVGVEGKAAQEARTGRNKKKKKRRR